MDVSKTVQDVAIRYVSTMESMMDRYPPEARAQVIAAMIRAYGQIQASQK